MLVLKKFTEVMQIRGVKVYLHWSVILVGGLILLGAIERPAETLIAWTCYFGVLLIHECGHMVVAQRKNCHVYAIELYPIHGMVRYSQPWSKFDDAVIAWGGVLAQFIVGIPLVIFMTEFGWTRFTALNVAIGVLGYFSVLVAALSLLPIRPLDGSKAWYACWRALRRSEKRPAKKEGAWRS